MNHIQSLTNTVKSQANALKTFDNAATDFRAFLSSAKFTGTGTDGTRKDWISTADVMNWLRETQSAVANEVNP